MNPIDKINRVAMYGTDSNGNTIEMNFDNVYDVSISTSIDEKAEVSFSSFPDMDNKIFEIKTNPKEEGEDKAVNGSLIYCRFSNAKYEFNLSTKLYAYYMPIAPEHSPIGIGTIFTPLDNWGLEMYKNTLLRCEQIIGVQNITDADFLAGVRLKTINNAYVSKQSNLYQDGKTCIYDKIGKCYKYGGVAYPVEEFWEKVVKYEDISPTTKDTILWVSSNDERNNFCIKENNNNKGVDFMEKKNIFGNVFKNMKFGKIDTNSIKYSFNGIAFQTDEGGYVVYNDDLTFTNIGNMTIDIPIFVMPVTKKEIKKGDIILHNGSYVIVNAVADNEINVARPWNKEIVSIIPEKSIFGFDFYTKVINPFDGFGATANEQNPFGNMMPFLFLSDSKNSSTNDMLMMMMMLSGNIDTTNPLLMYAMMSDENINPMMFLAMSGNNPLASMMKNTSTNSQSA